MTRTALTVHLTPECMPQTFIGHVVVLPNPSIWARNAELS